VGLKRDSGSESKLCYDGWKGGYSNEEWSGEESKSGYTNEEKAREREKSQRKIAIKRPSAGITKSQ